jgi:hypothetical protein
LGEIGFHGFPELSLFTATDRCIKNSFEFKSTNETFVSKVIDKFNVKKATGVVEISVKLMKLGKISKKSDN